MEFLFSSSVFWNSILHFWQCFMVYTVTGKSNHSTGYQALADRRCQLLFPKPLIFQLCATLSGWLLNVMSTALLANSTVPSFFTTAGTSHSQNTHAQAWLCTIRWDTVAEVIKQPLSLDWMWATYLYQTSGPPHEWCKRHSMFALHLLWYQHEQCCVPL